MLIKLFRHRQLYSQIRHRSIDKLADNHRINHSQVVKQPKLHEHKISFAQLKLISSPPELSSWRSFEVGEKADESFALGFREFPKNFEQFSGKYLDARHSASFGIRMMTRRTHVITLSLTNCFKRA